jgi:hypothetical protein
MGYIKGNELTTFDDIMYIKIMKRDGSYVMAVADMIDIDLVRSHTWSLTGDYIASYINGKGRSLARLILDAPDSMQVDHIDHDPLNNTRDNLRLVDKSQNQMNRLPGPSTGSERWSRYKGVSRRKSNGKWRAKINKISLGTFSTEIEAAAAYDMAALSLFGEYAFTNEEAFGKS